MLVGSWRLDFFRIQWSVPGNMNNNTLITRKSVDAFLWERLEFYFAMILSASFIFSSTQLCVLRPFTMMKKKKMKARLKLLQNKIPNAPIRVGLSGLIYSLFLLVGSVRMT